MAKYYRINQNIAAPNLRVIDATGQQLGVLSKPEALELAAKAELDLVEIAPLANPPVVRIVDFEKFRYEENKKAQAAKKGDEGGLKELWLSPRIAQHDLETRLRRAQEFLDDGQKVKLTVKFRGREMGHQELGRQVLEKATTYLGEKVMVEREPKMEGRNLSIIIVKSKGKKVEDNETKI